MPNEPIPTAIPQDPYLDATRFPLTTQKGLNLQKQKLIDAVNKDDIRRLMEAGKPIPPDLQAIWKEFEEKAKLGQGAGPAAPPPAAA